MIGYYLYTAPPFLSKFLGDGILFLWDTKNLTDIEICNSIGILKDICTNYNKSFYPEITKKMVSAPSKLRCGIAERNVFSVGDGNDS